MSGKSKEYWLKKFDESTFNENLWKDTNKQEIDTIKFAAKTIDLLHDYSGFFTKFPLTNLPMTWGGSIHRFFEGRWGTHNGDEVERAIKNFYIDNPLRLGKKYYQVEYVLALVKKEMELSKKSLKPNGDLARILEAVKDKTGVDYKNIDAKSVCDRYEQQQAVKFNLVRAQA